jgi:hypothetical protein
MSRKLAIAKDIPQLIFYLSEIELESFAAGRDSGPGDIGHGLQWH